MKSPFSFFHFTFWIWMSSSSWAWVWARDIIVITYGTQGAKAQLVEKMVKDKMKIPPRLIKRRWQKDPCEKSRDAILQICLKDDGEMVFPVVKKDVIFQSFKVFRERD